MNHTHSVLQIVLSDIIVLWRAWVVWSRNRVVKTISVVLITSTLGACTSNAREFVRAD